MLFSLFMLVTGWVIGVLSVFWLEEYIANVPYSTEHETWDEDYSHAKQAEPKPGVKFTPEYFFPHGRLVVLSHITIGEGQTIDDIKRKIK